MKTEVKMKRNLFGQTVLQKHKTGFLCATDLVTAGNKFRYSKGESLFQLNNWISSKGAKDFIIAIEAKYKVKAVNATRGRNSKTWVHPLLFIDLALAIDNELKIEVYEWLQDELLKSRDMSGDSYKRMTGSLFEHAVNKADFSRNMSKLCFKIKSVCKVKDWQGATEEELKLRDKIHNNIALLSSVLRDNKQAISLGLKESFK